MSSDDYNECDDGGNDYKSDDIDDGDGGSDGKDDDDDDSNIYTDDNISMLLVNIFFIICQ